MRPASSATSSVSECTEPVLKEFFDEGFPALAVGLCPSPIDTVRQFYSGDS
jgi:hypothetical protein